MLVVAPLSGHFASLLRNTVRTLLPDNDVYITDWHNARDVCLGDGTFGFDDYTELVIRFMETIGPGRAHARGVPAVCLGARRDSGDGRRGERGRAAKPHPDGGPDRR